MLCRIAAASGPPAWAARARAAAGAAGGNVALRVASASCTVATTSGAPALARMYRSSCWKALSNLNLFAVTSCCTSKIFACRSFMIAWRSASCFSAASWISSASVSCFLSPVVFAFTGQKAPACAALAPPPPQPAVSSIAVAPAPSVFGAMTEVRAQLPMHSRARSGGSGAGVPLGATPTNDQALVAKPAHRCWPAQLLPGESTKKTRGIVTWNSPHCHSGVAR